MTLWNYFSEISISSGIKIDNKLSRKAHIDDTALKQITANAMLCKVIDFVNAGTLKAIYHNLFESHPSCMYYMGTECMHSQSSFHTSKEIIKINPF